MRVLLIDNHDSFTYNLAQLIGEVDGTEPLVMPNDADQLPMDRVDAIVLSPGPGRPERRRDVGLSAEAVRRARVPLLGVCLGHQTMAHVLGGRVVHAPAPVHGGVDAVHHDGRGLLRGLPSPFRAVRYHSLCVTDLPPDLEVVAHTRDGVVMAVAHRTRPLWGVQFHPESICTDHGHHVVAMFRDEVARWWQGPGARHRHGATVQPRPAARSSPVRRPPRPYRLHVRELGRGIDAAAVFDALYADAPTSFWLDSATAANGQGRWSFLGDASGPHAEVVTYDVARREVRVETGGVTRRHHGDVFGHLDAELARRRIENPADAPGPFTGGYVGYLGYEVKADTVGVAAHHSPRPDAGFVFADRLVMVDHRRDVVWAVALSRPRTRDAAEHWLDATAARLRRRGVGTTAGGRVEPARAPVPAELPVTWRHGPHRYLELIDACLREIRDGESYELCLTDMATVHVDVDPVATYNELRRVNPAPHGALLRLSGTSVLSSSPERFLRVTRDRRVEARPIKGTRRRAGDAACDAALADDLAMSDKDRAENLMIVDLLRNDLGSVCETGSVEVPGLFDVESYATVHQLVSTVRGRLRADVTPVGCVRAAFPGGSMTGAPKQRSLEILDRLEAGPRGVYSGVLGYFALTGEIDLSIVIRTLVVAGGEVSFGAGGAIVAASDPHAEVDEVLTKARPLLTALGRAVAGAAEEAQDDLPAAGPGRAPTADRPVPGGPVPAP